jgi:hypothetical protein
MTTTVECFQRNFKVCIYFRGATVYNWKKSVQDLIGSSLSSASGKIYNDSENSANKVLPSESVIYEDVIDRLERKYTRGIISMDSGSSASSCDRVQRDGNCNEDDNDDGSMDYSTMDKIMISEGSDMAVDVEDDGNGDMTGDVDLEKVETNSESIDDNLHNSECISKEQVVDHKKTPTKIVVKSNKKRQRTFRDSYDLEDDFIDDSDEVQEIEAAMLMKKFKDTNNSFFASNGYTDIQIENSELVKDKLKVDNVRINDVNMNENRTISINDVENSILLPKSIIKKVPSNKLQMPWIPTAKIRKAFEDFEVAIKNVDLDTSTSKKKEFPRAYDNELYILDDKVCKEVSNISDINYNEYCKNIIDILGNSGKMSVLLGTGVVKNSLKRVRSKSKVNTARDKKDTSLKILLQALPKRITESQLNYDSIEGNSDNKNEHSSQFKFTCMWDLECRQYLFEAEKAFIDWVHVENNYRKTLTNVDKRGMEPDDTVVLDMTNQIEIFMQTIEATFPFSCQFGDMASLRKQLSIEKTRLHRKNKKENAGAITDTLKKNIKNVYYSSNFTTMPTFSFKEFHN